MIRSSMCSTMRKRSLTRFPDAYPKLTTPASEMYWPPFLFTGDRVFQKIGTLSGGEKGRVSLAKLMLSNANFLILDEPTNHLDIQSREILEDAINDYEGTVFYVSHDRYFINQTATRILDLSRRASSIIRVTTPIIWNRKKREISRRTVIRSSAPQ